MTKKGKSHTKETKLKISRTKQPKYGEANFGYVLHTYRGAARERNRIWDIPKEDFRRLTSGNCFYCGKKPANIRKRANRTEWGVYLYNGLDRLDNDKGYTVDNVVPCCAMCNRMKWVHSQEEFLAKIKEMYEHLKLGE